LPEEFLLCPLELPLAAEPSHQSFDFIAGKTTEEQEIEQNTFDF
jgi:hypothetical protein